MSVSVLRYPTGEFHLLSSPVYNVEPVTNTSSSSCANNGRRGECSTTVNPLLYCGSTLAAVRRGIIFHTSPLVRLTTLKTCMQRSQIFVQNRVFCLSHLHSTPPLERFRSEYRHPVWYGKTRMVWLPDGEKISRYVYSF